MPPTLGLFPSLPGPEEGMGVQFSPSHFMGVLPSMGTSTSPPLGTTTKPLSNFDLPLKKTSVSDCKSGT